MPTHFADSYADILLRCGFADETTLGARLDRWAALIRAADPRLIITDFAPTAMLAARWLGIPVAAVENGYSLPPAETPLPFTRAWEVAPPGRIAALDGAVLAVINACLVARGASPLPTLAALFDTAGAFLCTVPELDHYPARGPADYFGPVYATQTGTAPDWPPGTGPRVFAYLDAAHPTFQPTLDALARKGWPTALHVRGGTPLTPANIRLHKEPVQLTRALAECDLVIGQGLATITAALLAGRPVVQMPGHLEQTMILHRVVLQGLGVGVLRAANADGVTLALDTLQRETAYTTRARAFADRYHGFTAEAAAAAVVEACEYLL